MTNETSFRHFAEQLSRIENIDSLPMNPAQRSAKKADYFCFDRRMVLELKEIETSPKEKLDAFVSELRSEPDWPIGYGHLDLTSVVSQMQNGEALYRKFVQKVTDSVEDAFRKSNQQLRETSRVFGLGGAIGITVFVKRTDDCIDISQMVHRIVQCLRKRKNDGIRYESVDGVWIIEEDCARSIPDYDRTSLSVRIASFTDRAAEAEKMLRSLDEAWTEYLGSDSVSVDESYLNLPREPFRLDG